MPTSEAQLRAVKKYRQKIKQYVADLREAGCCMDCGEDDPVVLEFHHRDPSEKVTHISDIERRGFPAVLRELEKCDLICANCHLRRHASIV